MIKILVLASGVSQVALEVKNTPAGAGDVRDVGSIPGSGKSPEKVWESTPLFLPGESYGQRGVIVYSP